MSDRSSPRRSVYARLCDRATRLLAMRDHSEHELRRKLAAPFMVKSPQDEVEPIMTEDVDKVISWCYEHHWLDDANFAGRYIASRSRKGYGPQRIRQELQQKGLSREHCDAAFRACDIDWTQITWDIAVRKFGEPLPRDYPTKVKVQRFLLYRGFLMEDIQEIYRNFAD
ncbi:recombination regulator RecX [Atlantibacter hermannii]|uniref:recombination regulator RecX n=1 Tax=Atlantibacter hermannii TaxID=565 RepID=UPI0028A9EC5B|nr:recombination regulator RecX [Atlantibacter hermannii]